MDKMIYTSLSGVKHVLLSQAVATNNLANASTVGFRADLQEAETRQIYGGTHPSRFNVLATDVRADLSPGAIMKTGRDLDVAIAQEGWFAVQKPDGTEAYTRAGSFHLTETGALVSAGGLPVLGDGGPIILPEATKIDIGKDGSITILPLGQEANAVAVVERLKLVNPDPATIEKDEMGLFRLKAGGNAEADASVQVVSGALENSNVNAVTEIIKIMSYARDFEMNIKLMKAAEDNSNKTEQIMQAS